MYTHDYHSVECLTANNGIEYVCVCTSAKGNNIFGPKDTYMYRCPASSLVRKVIYEPVRVRPVKMKEKATIEPFSNDVLVVGASVNAKYFA